MQFEWDERKRRQNLADHRVDFIDIVPLFEGPLIEAEDDRGHYGERRVRALGRIGDDHFVVVYTWRGDARRLISAWRVDEDGRRRYQALLARRDQGDDRAR